MKHFQYVFVKLRLSKTKMYETFKKLYNHQIFVWVESLALVIFCAIYLFIEKIRFLKNICCAPKKSHKSSQSNFWPRLELGFNFAKFYTHNPLNWVVVLEKEIFELKYLEYFKQMFVPRNWYILLFESSWKLLKRPSKYSDFFREVYRSDNFFWIYWPHDRLWTIERKNIKIKLWNFLVSTSIHDHYPR